MSVCWWPRCAKIQLSTTSLGVHKSSFGEHRAEQTDDVETRAVVYAQEITADEDDLATCVVGLSQLVAGT